jgi:hypothetical protein
MCGCNSCAVSHSWLSACAAAAAAAEQKGLPYVRERSIMSVSMPNTWNFAWNHALFVQVGVSADQMEQ